MAVGQIVQDDRLPAAEGRGRRAGIGDVQRPGPAAVRRAADVVADLERQAREIRDRGHT